MANQKITITIIDETGGSAAPSPAQDEDESQNEKDKKKKSILSPKQHLALSYMEQFGSQVLTAAQEAIDTRYSLEEDYVGQTNLQNAVKAISIASGFAKSIYTGAVSGAKAGAVGAVVGAVVSSSLYAGKTILAAQISLTNQARSMDQQAYGQYFNSVRYGLINDSHGTEN